MRSGFSFLKLFIGGFFILLGVTAILHNFNIDIPVFGLAFSLLIIYLGILFLTGKDFSLKSEDKGEQTILFTDNHYDMSGMVNQNINVIFGRGIIDFTDNNPENYQSSIEINTIFASTEILISRELPVKITTVAAFGSAALPDKNSVFFGEGYYNSGNIEESNKTIEIKVNAIFASTTISII